MTKQINKLSSKPFINGELLWNKIKREGVSKKWTRQTKVLNDLCCYVINYRIIYPFHIILCRSFIHHTQAMEGINESNMEREKKICAGLVFSLSFWKVLHLQKYSQAREIHEKAIKNWTDDMPVEDISRFYQTFISLHNRVSKEIFADIITERSAFFFRLFLCCCCINCFHTMYLESLTSFKVVECKACGCILKRNMQWIEIVWCQMA